MRRQVGQRIGEIDALRDRFEAVGEVAENVEAVISALDALRDEADRLGLAALGERQRRLLAELQRLELALREGEAAARPSLSARVPLEVAPRHQRLAERYYRQLSEAAGED